ncbi:MAG: autotransporter outer membrane beta-barrel domain-containing protein [Zoogloeaceae bacterium]|jgi:hypothetical protein|nr:autotransporter outer membrane beta-barrel domain-containing protein [Zoogloeaceae bacterium]
MKPLVFRRRKIAVCLQAALLAALVSSLEARAEDVHYDGFTPPLRFLPVMNASNSLAPLSSASGNHVTVDYAPGTPGAADPEYVLGGESDSVDVHGNLVEIRNGQLMRVFGGHGESVDVHDNTVIVRGGDFTDSGDYLGRYIVGGQLYGKSGAPDTRDVLNNHLEIHDGIFMGFFYLVGGRAVAYSYDGMNMGVIAGNSVLIEGGTFGPPAYYLYGQTNIYGGYLGEGNAFPAEGVWENTVTIRGGKFLNAALVYGGLLDKALPGATVRNNEVIIEGMDDASMPMSIVGGEYLGANGVTFDVDVTGNVVDIRGGKILQVTGGSGQYYGGGGNVSHNIVNISGASDGMISGWIVGGDASVCNHGPCNATHNIVTLGGVSFVGGVFGTLGDGGDVFTGNTLNLKTRDTLTAENGVSNFEYLNFHLPASLQPDATLIRTQSGESKVDNGKIALLLTGGVPPLPHLKPGDSIRLIDATEAETYGGGLSANGINAAATATQGVAFRYDFDLFAENHILWAKLKSGPINPQTEALPEGVLAGSALMNQGADFLARLWPETVRAGQHLFAAASGGNLRHNTGSHVSVKGHALIAGMAVARPMQAGEFHLGGFIEHGRGDYNTRNNFANAATVHGGGDTHYTGGGALLRLQWPETENGRWHAEASLRAGRVKLDFNARDLVDQHGRRAAYRSRSPYAGLHARLGHLRTLDERSSLELYAQYLWTRQGSDTVTLTTGEPVKFHAVNSHRTQLGARLDWTLNERINPYVGLAWEHEYDGKAKASVYGYSLPTPKLQGDTGIVEAGFTVNPTALKALTLDAGIQGYAGKREGVTGSIRANYRF